MNAEFQRIARRDKKVFLSDQCKAIEENNRMGKTRDLFKKIRDTKGTFHVKMGSIGNSLVVQWLRLCASKAGGPGSIPGQGARSHRAQLRPGTAK